MYPPRYDNSSIDGLPPLPYLQLKALLELMEFGFQFEQAQKIAFTILEIDSDLSLPNAPPGISSTEVTIICVAPHPRGWALLSHGGPHRPYLFCDSQSEAIDRARNDSDAAECCLCIYDEDCCVENQITAHRHY